MFEFLYNQYAGIKKLIGHHEPIAEDSISRLEQWRANNQGEQVIMILSEYVKQYGPEFTGNHNTPTKRPL